MDQLVSYAALREFGIQKTIKKIIWIFNISDLSDLDYELNNEAISKYFYLNNFSQKFKNKTSQYDLLYNK